MFHPDPALFYFYSTNNYPARYPASQLYILLYCALQGVHRGRQRLLLSKLISLVSLVYRKKSMKVSISWGLILNVISHFGLADECNFRRNRSYLLCKWSSTITATASFRPNNPKVVISKIFEFENLRIRKFDRKNIRNFSSANSRDLRNSLETTFEIDLERFSKMFSNFSSFSKYWLLGIGYPSSQPQLLSWYKKMIKLLVPEKNYSNGRISRSQNWMF